MPENNGDGKEKDGSGSGLWTENRATIFYRLGQLEKKCSLLCGKMDKMLDDLHKGDLSFQKLEDRLNELQVWRERLEADRIPRTQIRWQQMGVILALLIGLGHLVFNLLD